MKRIVDALVVLSVILLATTGSATTDQSIEVTRNLTSMPLAFTPNHGQWDEQVSFRANAGGATMWFSSDGAYYQFTRTIESDPISVVDKRYGMPDDMRDRQTNSIETMMIKANFVGANPSPQMVGVDMIDYKCNYFIGNDQSKWRTDVPNYTAVLYEQVYDGIDLKYYGNGKQMEYDFIVKPGADFSQIKIQYEGAESVSVNDCGELVVTTMWGKVVEQKPVIYQIENGSRIAVSGDYDIKGTSAFGFKMTGDYNSSLPLVIDPILSYSTYLGGSGSDYGESIAVDGSGSAYVMGTTYSTDFPTLNPYLGTFQGGIYDVFVTKLSSSGNSLVYSTYLGGGGQDEGRSIAVDGSGSAYVTGHTYSTDFPTLNPYLGTFQGGTDVFVTKLSSSGNSLVYSTYLGGSGYDYCYGIAVDGSGSAYVTGCTNSPNYPTLNPYQTTCQGYALDAFVTKLSSSGNSLVYSTYLGGSGSDQGHGIAVDGSGSAYVTGGTTSPDFPTLNPYQTDQAYTDAFVTKLSSSGNSLLYSTYLGGSDLDYCQSIAVDGSGSAYVTGYTGSTDFPTLNPYQTDQAYTDAFVTKLSSSGGSLVYSTYLGGSSSGDIGFGIAVDGSGSAYVTGYTYSTDFPTLNPYQTTNQGSGDVFVTKLSNSGNSLVYSTYLGGSDDDRGYGIAIDGSGSIYVMGDTYSTDFPTLNPYQTDYGGGDRDAFVTKLTSEIPPGSISGSVTANCPAPNTGLASIMIDLYEQGISDLVISVLTDVDGNYLIENLTPGDYIVTGIIPLSFDVIENEVPITLVVGATEIVDFPLTCIVTAPLPPGLIHTLSSAYWKGQVGTLVKGQVRDIDATTMCGYLDMIEGHFNSNDNNQVVVYEPPTSDVCMDKLLIAADLLNARGDIKEVSKARQQLIALLLNVASGKLSQTAIISEDGATVSQAITYCDNLIDDPVGDHEVAKTICRDINKNRQVVSGVIPLSTPDIAYKQGQVPVTYSLSQNYPNPFNPTTEISFEIPQSSNVKLEVFNITGQKVATLVDGRRDVGYHIVNWDGSSVASGVYLYRIEAGDFVESRKMVLLK